MKTLQNICTSSYLFHRFAHQKTGLTFVSSPNVPLWRSTICTVKLCKLCIKGPKGVKAMQHSEYKTLAFKDKLLQKTRRPIRREGTSSRQTSALSCGCLRCGPCWLDWRRGRPELGQVQPKLPLYSGERRHGQVVAAHVVFAHRWEVSAYCGLGPRWVTEERDGGELF